MYGLRDPVAIFARAADDPTLRFRSADEMLAYARRLLARTADVLPRWFGRFPTSPLRIEATPAAEAAAQVSAHYQPASLDGRVPAAFYLDTSHPETSSRVDMAAMSLHEGIPGHHLQQALEREIGDVPIDRQHGNDGSFVEGWALYAESLGDDMGVYQEDAERLGRWRDDAFRGARLVVDTGLHAQGWSTDRAVAYLREHAGLSEERARSEVARYLEGPTQALTYKVGALEIRRLRDEARQRLGERFDVRAFHDALLGAGSIPMPIASERLERWIEQQAARHVAKRQ
jgi:uncharacterized protein (DUF885 family)